MRDPVSIKDELETIRCPEHGFGCLVDIDGVELAMEPCCLVMRKLIEKRFATLQRRISANWVKAEVKTNGIN